MEFTTDLAKQVLELLKSTTNFVKEQAPDVVQQLLTFKAWQYSLTLVLCVVFDVIAWRYFLWIKKILKSLTDDQAFALVFCSALVGAGLLVFNGVCLFDFAPKLVEVIVAPKLFLIEFLSEIVLGNSHH